MNTSISSRGTSAIVELVIAASFWGFGFIAAIWALEAMGPLGVTGWRFFYAAAIGLAIILPIRRLRREITWRQFWLAGLPGSLLSLTIVLQTWGLRYTTATKSGFITCLYVLMVPLLERLLLKRKLHRWHYAYVLVALAGVALIGDIGLFFGSDGTPEINFGDLLTLFCALAASFQILSFGFIADRIGHSFVFNVLQAAWAGAIPLLLALLYEPNSGPSSALPFGASLVGKPLWGLAALVFGSTLIGFGLQVRAQKFLRPSVASLLFLLESPFATLFAIYFLGESLRTEQWAGAGLILVAAAASSFATAEAPKSEV